MNESQIAEAVRSAVDDATAGLTARPDAAQRARRQGRRRRTVRGLLTGVPAIALAGAGAAFAVHGSGTVPGAGTAAPHRDVLTAAYVTRQAETALGQAGHYIVQTSKQMPGASNITWSDPATGNEWQVVKGGDTIYQWFQPYRAGSYLHWKITVADMGNRTWYSDTVRASEPMRQQPPSSAAELSPFTSPEQIKQALSSGKVTIAGKSTVNGQAAIDLRLTTKNTQLNYWVNAQTYQPEEMVVGSGHAVDITWLPKTKSLLTKVNTPQIPAGFQHVSAPAQH
jgi:hypothetical protein